MDIIDFIEGRCFAISGSYIFNASYGEGKYFGKILLSTFLTPDGPNTAIVFNTLEALKLWLREQDYFFVPIVKGADSPTA